MPDPSHIVESSEWASEELGRWFFEHAAYFMEIPGRHEDRKSGDSWRLLTWDELTNGAKRKFKERAAKCLRHLFSVEEMEALLAVIEDPLAADRRYYVRSPDTLEALRPKLEALLAVHPKDGC